MKLITLLPADIYTVINKTILTDSDRNNIISLYEPIIGPIALSLYFTLWRDLDKLELMSKDFTHHHLISTLKTKLDDIRLARETLEAVGLLRTYLKEGEINSYIYELYSPLTPKEFFLHPVLNIVLYNNLGKSEYEILKNSYEIAKYDLKEYTDISKELNHTFKSVNGNISSIEIDNIRARHLSNLSLNDVVDFDLIVSSLPKNLINDKTFNKKIRELINEIAFIYNYDSLKMTELLRLVINEKGLIDKDTLRKNARKYYQYENSGSLPTLIYRTQPEYLKTPSGDDFKRGKMIMVFENTSPYDFLRSKYKGSKPAARDLKILENLIVDLELKPAVVNVLIDYVLKCNNNKLVQGFIETIAGQWKRLGIETANEAMNIAESEHKKIVKREPKKEIVKTPVWFDKNTTKEEANAEEIEELENMLKEFR